jgi:hypothetical protein
MYYLEEEKGEEPALCGGRLCKYWDQNEYINAEADFGLFMKRF